MIRMEMQSPSIQDVPLSGPKSKSQTKSQPESGSYPIQIGPKSDQNRPKSDQNRIRLNLVTPKPAFLDANFYDFLAKTQIQSFHTGRKNVLQLIYVIQIFVKNRLSNRIQRTVKSMVLMLLMLHAVLMAGFSSILVNLKLNSQIMSEYRVQKCQKLGLKYSKMVQTVEKYP